MKIINIHISRIIFTVCLILLACRDTTNNEPLPFTPIQQPAFTVPQEYSQLEHQLVRADLDNNGLEDIIMLLSNQTSGSSGFDSLLVFQYDTANNAFKKTFNSGYDRGQRIDITNITDDLNPEILVYTDAGGSSPVASLGLTILTSTTNGIRTLRTFSEGRPHLVQLGQDSVLAISLFTNYGNLLLKTQEVPYIDSLVFFRTLDPERERALKSEFLRVEINRINEEYLGAKARFRLRKTNETLFRVYSFAVQKILYYKMLGDMAEMNKWYQEEQQFWNQNFTSDYIDMLDEAREEHLSL